jgi:hypothetical protein
LRAASARQDVDVIRAGSSTCDTRYITEGSAQSRGDATLKLYRVAWLSVY